nr:retrotransposon Gag domain, retroviral aspartyl protease [Tanacetum cinerariifolium]
MVQTRSNLDEGNLPPDPIATQLAVITKKLESIDALQKDVATLKSQSHNQGYGNGRNKEGESSRQNYRSCPHNKILFPTFSDGDPRGWILKAEKHFRYYDIPKDEKVVSIALEFESKISHTWYGKGSTWPASSKTNHPEPEDVLVKDLKCNTQAVAPFGVQIGNEDFIRCDHICKNLAIHIDDLKIVQDFYPFSIGGADLVLGIRWMETLNTVQANWKEMFMIFNVEAHYYNGTTRLLLKLMPYDFSISHRAGKENKGADALSRRPYSGTLSVEPNQIEIEYQLPSSDIWSNRSP